MTRDAESWPLRPTEGEMERVIVPAPSPSLLARIIAWRDALYRKWAAKKAPAVPAKNPRRVQGAKDGWETRRRRKAAFIEAEPEAIKRSHAALDAEGTP